MSNEYNKEIKENSANLAYFGDLELKTSNIKCEVEKIPQFVKLLPSNSILFEELNAIYVLTCSNDFERTAKSVIAGLDGARFSKDDYRQKDFREL